MKIARTTAKTIGAIALGVVFGASVAFGAAFTLKSVKFSNTWAQGGYGIDGTESYDGTFIIERFGQRNGVADTGIEHPALWVRTAMNNPASAFRASSGKGVSAYIGSAETSGANPAFTADKTPALFVGDGHFQGKLNTNGQKNGNTAVNYVAVEARGAIKLCGKSSTNDPECTSQAYLYLKDGSGDLVIKFADGTLKTLATAP
jgi:hypothetical protein